MTIGYTVVLFSLYLYCFHCFYFYPFFSHYQYIVDVAVNKRQLKVMRSVKSSSPLERRVFFFFVNLFLLLLKQTSASFIWCW